MGYNLFVQRKGHEMKLQEAKSIVAESIQGHTRMVRMMNECEAKPFSTSNGWDDAISQDAHLHIAQIAFAMVETLSGSWRDTTSNEFGEFLNECGLNGEWVTKYCPPFAIIDEVTSY